MKRLFFLLTAILLLGHSILATEIAPWDHIEELEGSVIENAAVFVEEAGETWEVAEEKGDDVAEAEAKEADGIFFAAEDVPDAEEITDFLSEVDALTAEEEGNNEEDGGEFTAALVGAPPFHNAKAGDVIDQGSYGGNLTWKLIILQDTDPNIPDWSEYAYELAISGTGAMQDFTDHIDVWTGNNYVRSEYSDQIHKLTISPGITHIGDYAFDSFWSLKEVTIPSTVTSIGRGAFGCTAITTINLPSSLTSLGYNSLSSDNLETLNYPGTDRQLASLFAEGAYHDAISNWPEGYSDGCDYYGKLNWIVGPANPWIQVHGKAKAGDILEEGTLPTGVTYQLVVDDPAHWQQPFDPDDDDGTGIQKIYNAVLTFSGKGAIPDYVLQEDDEYVYKEEELPVWKFKKPEALKDMYTHVSKIVVGDGVTSIGSFAFYHMNNLEEVVLGSSVTSIRNGAFLHCIRSDETGKEVSGLTKVTLPASLKTIMPTAFWINPYITTIETPLTPRELANLVYFGDERDLYMWWTGKIRQIIDDSCPWFNANALPRKGLLVDEGTCGGSLSWKLIITDMEGIQSYNENHDDTWDGYYTGPSLELIITGTGAMDNYVETKEDFMPAPWSFRYKYQC